MKIFSVHMKFDNIFTKRSKKYDMSIKLMIIVCLTYVSCHIITAFFYQSVIKLFSKYYTIHRVGFRSYAAIGPSKISLQNLFEKGMWMCGRVGKNKRRQNITTLYFFILVKFLQH